MDKPTRKEIADKLRDVLTDDEFEVIYDSLFPTPAEAHHEGVFLQFAGWVNGFGIWIKKKPIIGAAATIFVGIGLIGSFDSGCKKIVNYTSIAYEAVAEVVELGSGNCEPPANEFVIFDKPNDWPLNDDDPITIYAVIESATSTTTTTTTPAPDHGSSTVVATIPPGGGLVARMDSWHGV
jgi:hypothetical protein